MSEEIEIIRHPYLKHLNIFIVELSYRSPHYHHDFELLYILSGSATLLHNGITMPIKQEDFILFNPNETHEITVKEGTITILCIQFSPNFFQSIYSDIKLLNFDEVYLNRILTNEQIQTLRGLFIEVSYQYVKRQTSWQLLSGCLLGMLVSSLLKQIPWHLYTDEEIYSIDIQRKRIEHIISYVEENYMNKILLADLAKKERLSVGYLSHLIKQTMNQSFQDYVTSVRFHHAKLLLNTPKSLINVCLACGFSSTRYLTKAFLRYEGCTPTEYQQRNIDTDRTEEGMADTEHKYDTKEILSLLEKNRSKFGTTLDHIL